MEVSENEKADSGCPLDSNRLILGRKINQFVLILHPRKEASQE